MLAINFHPFPLLETDRLLLRRIDPSDADVILALRGNPELMKYIPRPLAKTKEDALAFIEMIDTNWETNTAITWSITLKEDSTTIGNIGYYRIQPENHRAEIGYMALAEYHGKGYVTEAIQALLRYGFEQMQLHSVEAVIDPNNIASERVLQKNGFVKEAHLIENEMWNGTFLDTVIYSLLKRNYIQ
jgi:ribosomal-protein-alanine N-acetyltransferase